MIILLNPHSLYLSFLPETPLGPIAAASTETGLLAIEIGVADAESWGRALASDGANVRPEAGPFPVAGQLREYFNGSRRAFDLPLDLRARTGFQRRVYARVTAIPFGETRTYAEIAAEIGRPRAAPTRSTRCRSSSPATG